MSKSCESGRGGGGGGGDPGGNSGDTDTGKASKKDKKTARDVRFLAAAGGGGGDDPPPQRPNAAVDFADMPKSLFLDSVSQGEINQAITGNPGESSSDSDESSDCDDTDSSSDEYEDDEEEGAADRKKQEQELLNRTLLQCMNKSLDNDPNIVVNQAERAKVRKPLCSHNGDLRDVHDIFGPMFKPEVEKSMYWAVTKESSVYKYKDLVTALKMPSIPNNLMQLKNHFMATVNATLCTFDRSLSGILSHWWMMLEDPVGHIAEEIPKYHANAQGLVMLDRLIGRLLATPHNFNHPLFGNQIKTYVRWCYSRRDSPSGRAIVVMWGVRFRINKLTGRHVSVYHLYQIQLKSLEDQAVATFMDRIRDMFCQLSPGDIKDADYTFQWLWIKVKNWKRIQTSTKKIRNSPLGHRRRTWQYLWNKMTLALSEKDEDKNENDVNQSVGIHVFGAAAKTRKEKKKKEKPKSKAKAKAKAKAAASKAKTGDDNASAQSGNADGGKKKKKSEDKPPPVVEKRARPDVSKISRMPVP